MVAGYADTAHLFRRVGFGGLHEEVERYQGWSWEALVDLVLDTSRAPSPPPFPDLSSGRSFYKRWVDMVHYWLDLARRPVDQAPVVEKMVLFWSGVLCSGVDKVPVHQALMDHNHTFRTLGMGNYDTLLQRISVGPAMVMYLDNDRNVAGRPNENFARELMELFTIGVGHYTENDVTESARAWTGHGVDGNDNYRFDGTAHDWNPKTFMGRTGNFDGPDIINIILSERRAVHARFMCRKLWSFFAYPVGLNDQEVTDIMATYTVSLNVRDTLRAIFLHPSFRSERARWALVRSPVEWVVALMRLTSTDCSVAHPEWALTGLGQDPFRPPNVSGWRQNEYWVTSTAAWAKIHVASRLRYHAVKRNDIADASEITDWSPITYRFSPAESVDKALWNFKVGPVAASSRQELINYVERVRASEHRSSERYGTLLLTLLLPELQMA